MTEGYQPAGQGTAGVTDAVSQLQNISRNLSLLVLAFKGRPTFGSFTMAAAASTVVAQPAVQANSMIVPFPTNAAAGTLVGSAKSPYLASISPGVSFTISTANAASAAGTETFNYFVVTPS